MNAPRTVQEQHVQAAAGRRQLQNEIARDLGAELCRIRREEPGKFEEALAEVKAFNQKHFPNPKP